MARRKDMLTEKKNPLALEVYRALGIFFIVLLESRWKSNVQIFEEFFSAITLSKSNEAEGTDRTWRRWKSRKKDNRPFLGDRPELVLDAVQWAKNYHHEGVSLISAYEANLISENFRTLLEWAAISKDSNEDLHSRIDQITDSTFELANLELVENPDAYRDKITGEIFDYVTLAEIESQNKIGTRNEKDLILRECAFDLMLKSERLSSKTLQDHEASELTLDVINDKSKVSTLSYSNKKAVLKELILESELLAERAFAIGAEFAVKEVVKAIKDKCRELAR